MEWRHVAVVVVFALCLSTVVSKAAKCSKLVSKIPVHKDFDIERYLGTWYTVRRTKYVWGEQTYESSSMVIARNPDDSLSYSFTGKIKGMCAPVETGVLKPGKRPGEFTLRGSVSPEPKMIVSFTDYKTALVFFCFKFRGGKTSVCKSDGSQVEIVTRSTKPAKRDVNAYISRSTKRLCVDPIDLFATTPGQCNVPDILEAARLETIRAGKTGSSGTSSGKCIVDNIPVQKDFDLSMMTGTWYEIARTRNTFNKLESVVTHFVYDKESGHVTSFYTGTASSSAEDTKDQCQTPLKSQTKPKHANGTSPGDLLGKIGDDESAYPWAPMKILYADDNYIMTYACYTGETSEPCKHEGAEVNIIGRTRDLDPESRAKLTALLSGVCVDESELLETSFLADCASHVDHHTKQTGPSDCYLDNMVVYDDYTKEELRGQWYLYGFIHFNSSAALSGVVMSKLVSQDQPVEPTETVILAFEGEDENGVQTCGLHRTRSRERCLDTADQITTLPFNDDSNFVFSKILHLSDSLLVEYVCTKATIDGRCEADGILFNAYKNISMDNDDDDDQELEVIYNMARSVCLDPDMLEFETEWCSIEQLVNISGPGQMADDDVDSLTIYSDYETFNQENLYGYWYLIARSNGSNELADLDPMVAYFTADSNATLLIYYTGSYNNDSGFPACSEVHVASMMSRCVLESNGDYLFRYKVESDYVLYAPFKVLHLEKDTVLVTYVCQHVLPNGRCIDSEAHTRIWGRNATLDEDTRELAVEMMYWANLDPTVPGYLIYTDHQQGLSCDATLKDYINSRGDDSSESASSDEDNDDGKEKEQNDKRKTEDDDLLAELLMDDDEFYYGE